MTLPSSKFLGRGWRFPPQFDLPLNAQGQPSGPGQTAMVAGDDDIRESLEILFSTFRGERLLVPEYGIGIEGDVFIPLDATTLGALRSKVAHAILFFEPRIKLRKLDLYADSTRDGVLMIEIDYDIPAINSRSNMVYPVYLKEGTNIRAR